MEQLDKKEEEKEDVNTNPTPFIKINRRWIVNLNEKLKIIKLLEDDIGENLGDLGCSDDFQIKHQKHNLWKKN